MGLKWTNFNNSIENFTSRSTEILGYAAPPQGAKSGGLNVALLSPATVCRQICNPNKRNTYHVWHAVGVLRNRALNGKISWLLKGGTWYLMDNWRGLSEKNSHLFNTDWLRLISSSEDMLFDH